MGHVEIRTRMASSILLTVVLTNLATEIINIMKEHVAKTSQKRHTKRHTKTSQKRYTIGITRPSLRLAGPNIVILLMKRLPIWRYKKIRLHFPIHTIFDTFPFFTNFDQISRSMLKWVHLCKGVPESTLKGLILDILTPETG